MELAMQISITIVVIILLLLTFMVCRMCFRKPKRPVSKYISHRSAASGEHILDSTDNRPNLSETPLTHTVTIDSKMTTEPLLPNDFDSAIIRKKVANNLIPKSDRLSEPLPTTRVLSRFLAQHEDHLHAGVVICNTSPNQNKSETNITVFDKPLSVNTVKRITELFEKHEATQSKKGKMSRPTFINIPTDSECDLLQSIRTGGLNRKLSLTQRMSENSGLKLPLESSCHQHLHCICTKEKAKESAFTIYGDASVFQFVDTIPNELLTQDLIEEING